MIEMKDVTFAYEKDRPLLDHFSLTIHDGESVGLIGANGAGKSTVMKILLGLLPFEGSVRIDGIEVNTENLGVIRQKMGFVLQNSDHQMFMPTVYEDMIFAPLNYGMSREEADQKVDEVLKELGIEDLKKRYNHRISGGEKRMAAIATILVNEPDVILMDEPTSALDPYNRRQIIRTINALEKTKVITSHDLDMILDTCSRVVLLSQGKIVADGTCRQILYDRRLLEDNRLELPFSLSGRES